MIQQTVQIPIGIKEENKEGNNASSSELYRTKNADIYSFNSIITPVIPLTSENEFCQVVMCDSLNNPIRGFPRTASISSTCLLPSITEFAGDLDFELRLDPADCANTKWLYSKELRKIFIDIDRVIGIRFKWNFDRIINERLFIRSLPVYTQDDWLRIPVERCPVHVAPKDNMNNGFPWVDHVLRCENIGTVYEIDELSRRKSCVTQVSKPMDESEFITLFFKFVCKTSCYRGMQRRPVVVIFTLEDASGTVIGRRCLRFKICSCLKRDKQREEEEWEKNRRTSAISVEKRSISTIDQMTDCHLSKVIKVEYEEGNEKKLYNESDYSTLYQLDVLRVDYQNYRLALITMHNALVGESSRNRLSDTQQMIKQLELLLQVSM